MDYVQYISTPKNTTETDPLITTLKLTRGRLTGGSVYFPSGPAGLLHLLVRVAIHQIFPFNAGQNLRLDNCVMTFSIGIDLLEPPYQVEIVTWNDSTLYAHVLTVCLSLDPRGPKAHSLKAIMQNIEQQKTPPATTGTEEKLLGYR